MHTSLTLLLSSKKGWEMGMRFMMLATTALALGIGMGCAAPPLENPYRYPVVSPRDTEVYEAGRVRSERLRTSESSVDVFVMCDHVVIATMKNQFLQRRRK